MTGRLQTRLDRIREGFEAQAPAEALAVMHRATDDLRACLAIRDHGPQRSLRATTTSSAGITTQVEIPTPITFPVRPAAQLATYVRPSPATDILFCPITYEGSDQGPHAPSRIWFTYRRL